jgi:hypothetical protein
MPVTVMVELAFCPAETVTLVGLAVTVKSLTVRKTFTESVTQQWVTSLAITVIVHVVSSVSLVAAAVKTPLPEPMVWYVV